jgi:hypothetical protein
MKKNIILCFLFITSVLYVFAQKGRQWAVERTFEHNVFIENKGQCNSSVLYYSTKGSDKIYFSSSSITFEYDSISKDEESTDEREDRDKLKKSPLYLSIIWEGANGNIIPEVQNEVSEYFTYPNPVSGMPSIVAHGWSKLIYRNLYNNIDIEFYYPEKGGIEYDIIAHPGADLSVIKMNYKGGQVSLINGNVSITSPFGVFTDHAPVSRDEKGSVISSSFQVNNNTVSFKTSSYDKNKALTIDPWVSTPSFTTTNSAYDIGYDFNGNVYIYGGGATTEYQLEKYSNSGVLQWTFNPTFSEAGGSYYFYGDLVTDTRNGDCYINTGASISGAEIDKVGTAGNIIRSFTDNANISEMWRIDLDYCHNMLVIGTGSNGNTTQAYIIDTAFVSGTAVNVLSTDSIFHDIALLALDQQGNAYMASAQTATGGSAANLAIANNVLIRLPIPSLMPTTYMVSDHYTFQEISSIKYYPIVGLGPVVGNGMNGMAANKNMVVTYDGASLKKWMPSNGQLEDSIKVSSTSFTWGGIDIDCNNNIYIGNDSTVNVYDSSLNVLSHIKLSSVIYDLKVTNQGLLYACGKGFVSAVSIPFTGCADSVCGVPILTSINNLSASKLVDIYPNPNDGSFTVSLHDITDKLSIEIYNVLGQSIYTANLIKPETNIDLKAQPKGVYFYNILDAKGNKVSSGKLILQ